MSYNGYSTHTCRLLSATHFSLTEGYSEANEEFLYQINKEKKKAKTTQQLTVFKCNIFPSLVIQVINTNISNFSLEDSICKSYCYLYKYILSAEWFCSDCFQFWVTHQMLYPNR